MENQKESGRDIYTSVQTLTDSVNS